jgi:hypothetical protein
VEESMESLLENRCLLSPHRFLDSAFGLASNDMNHADPDRRR